jgi:hypothetical protein
MRQKRISKEEGECPLNIVGFDDREQVHPDDVKLPEWMPKHEFFMLIVAPAGCGKTTLILNLLLRIYKNYFNEVKVFSPTIHNDQKWTHLTSTPGILRKNPHRKLFEKVPQKEIPQEDSSSSVTGSKGGEGENERLKEKGLTEEALQPDKFYFENFEGPAKRGKGGKKKSSRHLNRGSLKKMGKEYFEYWKQQHPEEQALLKDPKEIIQKELRMQKLSAIITKPTPPVLAQQCRQFNAMLGLSSSSVKSNPSQIGWGSNFQGEALQLGVSSGSRFCTFSGGGGGFGGGGAFFQGAGPSRGSGQQGARRRVIWNNRAQKHNHDGHQAGKEYDQEYANKEQNPNSVVGGHSSNNNSEDESTDAKKKKKQVKGAVRQESMFEEYSEETLQTIMDNQDKIVRHLSDRGKDMTMADHLCLVFDDMVGSGLFNAKRNNAFKRLTVRRRHFCSSVIGVVQAYKEFPKTSRNNTNIYVLFKIDSDEEIMGIYKDFPCGLRPEVWRRVYDYCTKEPYSFMMINLQVKDPKYRIVKNFNEPLNVPVYERDLQESWVLGLGSGSFSNQKKEREKEGEKEGEKEIDFAKKRFIQRNS